MDEGIKESLSALMDGEANELEIQRVLGASSNAKVRATWSRYHITRTVMGELNSEASAAASSGFADGVMAMLEGDNGSHSSSESQARKADGWLKPVASFAIAASVAGAVVVGGQWLDSGDPQQAVPAVAASVSRVSSAPPGSWGGVPLAASIQARPSGRSAAVDSAAIYDTLARERLQRYMIHNVEHAALNSSQGMMPFARVTRGEKR